jgi:hypothetical protein
MRPPKHARRFDAQAFGRLVATVVELSGRMARVERSLDQLLEAVEALAARDGGERASEPATKVVGRVIGVAVAPVDPQPEVGRW